MRKSATREYYEAILVAVIFALFLRTFVFENFKIPSGSMENGLLIGDHLVVNKFIYGPHYHTIIDKLLPFREPRRRDVVVFKFPEDPSRDFIKRCVGVPGDVVEVRHKALYINGKLQKEPYVIHKDPMTYPDSPMVPPSLRLRDNFGPYTVPPGTIFCMGDNRDNSLDSRFWGPVPRSYLQGRAVLIYWSWEARPNDWRWRGFGHRFKQLANVFLHFFTRTRWNRTFKFIR
ncbi:MAG: signal peptidase I [Acidobacteria bacterium]|jgi:signal peptidase I|nr:signal peptidase I [Acidobacteriota bacterium]